MIFFDFINNNMLIIILNEVKMKKELKKLEFWIDEFLKEQSEFRYEKRFY